MACTPWEKVAYHQLTLLEPAVFSNAGLIESLQPRHYGILLLQATPSIADFKNIGGSTLLPSLGSRKVQATFLHLIFKQWNASLGILSRE